jgi:hypothetical protein
MITESFKTIIISRQRKIISGFNACSINYRLQIQEVVLLIVFIYGITQTILFEVFKIQSFAFTWIVYNLGGEQNKDGKSGF